MPLLEELLRWADFGVHLAEPWNVVLTGRPNVGKSSLINALLGYQRAIVFDQPGTTRDVVTAETAFEGWPLLLADTAGLRETCEELEAAGIAMTRDRLEGADARLILVDLSQPPTPDDLQLIASWPGELVIGHKCDLGDQWQDQLPCDAIRASSVTGEGLELIQQRLVRRIVPEVPVAGTAVPVSRRQVRLLKSALDLLVTGDLTGASQQINRIFSDC
jgi:tRNA modification GTPase